MVHSILGYDPGGDKHHGIAILEVEMDGKRCRLTKEPLLSVRETLDDTLEWFDAHLPGPVLAAGVDTLTCWNGGSAGWRPADRWLIARCHEEQVVAEREIVAASSVLSPNGLRGAMIVNGGAFLLKVQTDHPGAKITEAHPKVWFYLRENRTCRANWNDSGVRRRMTDALTSELCQDVNFENFREDHAFDALASAMAALKGLNQEWTTDLHAVSIECGKPVMPFGTTHFWWPDSAELE
jgi:hypothetical protein